MTPATRFLHLRFALILLLSGLSGLPLLGSAWGAEEVNLLEALESVTTEELKGHIDFLADDTLEGREAGSRGGHAAATYLVKEFEKHKLAPAGDNNSYFQGFNGASRNILGVLEGSDPKLKQEVIVLAAHYDHVGYGRAGNSYGPFGYIHNGADDNASGVSGLLEIIDAIRRLPTPPKRTILFALWDAEEQGLIGSRFWVSRPTLPLQRVVLDINIDMIGRLKDDRVEAYGSRTLVGSRRLLSELNTATQLALDFDWRIKADSDHHPFFAQNIPFLMLHTCLHENYHRPSDDVHLLNFTGMQRVTRLTLETLLHYAEVEKIPKFRDLSRSESPREQQILEQSQLPQRPRFGLPWKKEPGEELQIVFQAPTAGSPAEAAGIKAGDKLLLFDGRPVRDEARLRLELLAAASAKTFAVRREGAKEPLEIQVQPQDAPIRIGIAWREDAAEPGTVIVTQVVPGSAAGVAGLKLKDRIYAMNGETFIGSDDFGTLIGTLPSPLELLVERRGQLFSVQLEALPAEAAP